MELTKTSKDIQGGIEICNLYWKGLGSIDEEEEVICGLRQMWTKYRI